MRSTLSFLAIAAALLPIALPAQGAEDPRKATLTRIQPPPVSSSPVSLRQWRSAPEGPARASIVSVATPPRIDDKDMPMHRCAGVLVAPQWALVAGICVAQADDEMLDLPAAQLEVYSGPRVNARSKPVKVERVVRHPDYDPLSLKGDLALVRLRAPLPGAVPAQLSAGAPPANGRTYNWQAPDGANAFDIYSMATPVMERGACETAVRTVKVRQAREDFVNLTNSLNLPGDVAQRAWRVIEGGIPKYVDETMACAGKLDEGVPCNLDTGAPWFGDGAGPAQLVGLMTLAPACELPGVPAIYTLVAPHLNWIRRTIGQ
jgi:secreted trypsin-like serine protease